MSDLMHKTHILSFFIAIMTFGVMAGPVFAQQPAVGSLVQEENPGIRMGASLSRTISSGHANGSRFVDPGAMQVFYAQRGNVS